MFVPEEKIFAAQVLRLRICALDGAEWLEEVAEDTAVERLKERCCLKHCTPGSLEDPKSVTHHKLIHAASEKVLSDTKTILEENIKDRDILVLMKKRAPPAPPQMVEISEEEKFQTELRKILVSLIEVAQKLLALNPDAVELFKKANAMLDEDEDDRVDEIALRQLTEMGFPESRAVKALRLSHMSVTQAMEWLIEHADDPTVDTPLPGQFLVENATGTDAFATQAVAAGASLDVNREEPKDELTEIFKKIRRKREFRPDPRAIIALMEMGFDEKEVVDALRVNNNQQNAACEWLLGDRKPTPEDLNKGIDPSSPLFQAILENPVIQLGLTNPKTLLAFRIGDSMISDHLPLTLSLAETSTATVSNHKASDTTPIIRWSTKTCNKTKEALSNTTRKFLGSSVVIADTVSSSIGNYEKLVSYLVSLLGEPRGKGNLKGHPPAGRIGLGIDQWIVKIRT
ncbi:ubiquitin-associated domain-containing protein 1 isoform X2 [Sphaerodactylus townsendi]|uniref:ubiquitin-associated domain-containing protein 1 isoform X2 n=1 Tax=Sphaerodactylus townsendi TaxID=933632 RepID=UPI0020267608|nr:ubiquitin-associated domain-containing protein 1 isoform X2 [Sphaerodactylus townsendi]